MLNFQSRIPPPSHRAFRFVTPHSSCLWDGAIRILRGVCRRRGSCAASSLTFWKRQEPERAARNLKYWGENSKEINRKRRQRNNENPLQPAEGGDSRGECRYRTRGRMRN